MFIPRSGEQVFAVSFGSAPRALLAIGGWVGSWELWLEVKPGVETSQWSVLIGM